MKPTSDRGKAAAMADPSSPPATSPAKPAVKPDPPRGTIAEWTITILLLLFGTTTLVQAFVIPTGSMEDTLLIGDHLLVDKLAYAPSGSISKYILPYENPTRRRHHCVPLSGGHHPDLRQARHRRARRSHQNHRPAGLSQRQEAHRAVRGSQELRIPIRSATTFPTASRTSC